MNPSTEGLKDRAATSPALFNRCVLNWFGDWSTGAFYQVAREFTNKIDLENSNVSVWQCGLVIEVEVSIYFFVYLFIDLKTSSASIGFGYIFNLCGDLKFLSSWYYFCMFIIIHHYVQSIYLSSNWSLAVKLVDFTALPWISWQLVNLNFIENSSTKISKNMWKSLDWAQLQAFFALIITFRSFRHGNIIITVWTRYTRNDFPKVYGCFGSKLKPIRIGGNTFHDMFYSTSHLRISRWHMRSYPCHRHTDMLSSTLWCTCIRPCSLLIRELLRRVDAPLLSLPDIT